MTTLLDVFAGYVEDGRTDRLADWAREAGHRLVRRRGMTLVYNKDDRLVAVASSDGRPLAKASPIGGSRKP